MSRYIPPVINLNEKKKIDNMLRRNRRLKKLRRLLSLSEKNMYISPGVSIYEND
jgi:hypothetical protein